MKTLRNISVFNTNKFDKISQHQTHSTMPCSTNAEADLCAPFARMDITTRYASKPTLTLIIRDTTNHTLEKTYASHGILKRKATQINVETSSPKKRVCHQSEDKENINTANCCPAITRADKGKTFNFNR